jgi:integrase/recombinase XerD
MARGVPMKALRDAIEDYVELRRSLGYQFDDAARELRHFALFMEAKGAVHVTIPLTLEWAAQLAKRHPNSAAKRVAFVRGFAHHWSATDSRTEVPPKDLLPYRAQRARPYIYSEEDIQKLLNAASQVPSKNGLRPKTYYYILGLLSVTGLRISEALNLDRADVDLDESMLIVRKTKFGKTRLVPLHTSAISALADYAKSRDAMLPKQASSHFFLNDEGRHVQQTAVQRTFAELSRKIGLRGPNDRRGPRLHDFRHRFAIHTLIDWYRQDKDVDRLLPVLSTFLGHVRASDTYWYISVEPELMGAATRRLERRWEVLGAE